MPELTRNRVALILGVAFAVLTLAVGIYGLVSGSNVGRSDRGHGSLDAPQVSNAGGSADHDPSTETLPETNDAIAYARAVATGLFDWDTTAGYLPADYQAPVLAEADPSGEEAPGLISDVDMYFPTVDQWLDLATMEVAQTLTIESAEVPTSWHLAVEQAHGELRPGTIAVTIAGTRTRTGVWNGEQSTTSSSVAFTVFIACRPAFDRCHVLRLSELDNPLR